MATPKKTINFLLESSLEKGPVAKFINWALKFGRYIVLFTQLIVILVFMARFKLDHDLAGINEEIEKKQLVVQASAELEDELRFLQKRLSAVSRIQSQTLEPSLIIDELNEITPVDVTYSELTINQNSLALKGASLSNPGVATFLDGLKKSEFFEQIDLRTISSGGIKDPSLKFEVTATLKPPQ